MPVIKIELQSESQNIILSGDIDNLLLNRRAKYYIGDLGGIQIGDLIQIPYEEQTLEKILERIKNTLDSFGFTWEPSDEVQHKLEFFIREDRKFKEFSKLAYLIREGKLSELERHNLEMFGKQINRSFPERQLYPLQLLSAYHLAFSQNACNFSVPGAGKTTIVYATYAYLKSLNPDNLKHVDKLVIIGPLSSFGPWEKEFEECFGILPSSKRLSGGVKIEERIKHFYSSSPAEISLVTYQGLAGIIDHLESYLKKHHCMVVLDEAHKIKNVDGGVIASSVLRIAKYCQARVVLTGTPAPNGYEDLYNLFKYIYPTKKIISFHEAQMKDMSKNHRDPRVRKLTDEIKPYFTRIKKSNLGLPQPINKHPIMVDMGEIQSEIYSFIERNYMDYFQSQNAQTSFQSLLVRARLVRLMQASTNPSLLRKPLDDYYDDQGYTDNIFIDDTEVINKILEYQKIETPPKFIEATEIIKQIIERGEKVVVWMTFVQNIKDFSEYLTACGITSKAIWGETPVDQDDLPEEIETREKIIAEFHKPKSRFKVLVANSFAIAESISLHKACHNAIYIERSFNAGNFIQSKDRIHRYGLKPDDKISYYYILSKNNIDTTIHQRLQLKENRMMEIIEGEEIPLFRLLDEDGNDDDLRTLINNYASRSF